MMMIVIIGFQVMLVVSIVLLIIALKERKAAKLKRLESDPGKDAKNNEAIRTDSLASEFNALDEKKQAVQLVHNALENVINSFAQAVSNESTLNDLFTKKNSTASVVDDTENRPESEIKLVEDA